MPENRKYFPHNSVIFITSRVEEGIPLPPSHIINAILWGIMAAARTLYDVRVCHFLFMGNHLHLLLMVSNPDHVSPFMRYVKSESSHAINKLLGRDKRTIWEEGYDSPIVPTSTKIIHYIKYIYLNPVRARLVDSIDEYPGVSSWEMFTNDITVTRHARIKRPLIKPLHSPALSINEQKAMKAEWDKEELQTFEFTLEPWAWLELFPEIDREDCKALILSELRGEEAYLRRCREREKKRVMGATALRRQSMMLEHTPKRRGRRMIVICEDKELRRAIIEHFRALCDAAAEAYERWKKGDLSARMPPGMFAPRVPTLVSALPF